MDKRINPITTTCADAARILIARYGRNALQIASNRQDAAQKGDTARFYIGVMDEIDSLSDDIVESIIQRNTAERTCANPIPDHLFEEVENQDALIEEQEAIIRSLEDEMNCGKI